MGYSLVSTAVRTRGPASTAARIPAPPAPTITTSYRCWQINAAADDAVGAPPAAKRRGGRSDEVGVPPACGGEVA
ncbi:hypothetical protein [Mycobacterium tuberculosis]|uniref:hypothetical protein n=1 Tax=Mycobacterium tuberculosis TaxID=1773 RepID=UPI00099A853A|nr:hypothetical protein [Mycobacterium tuberculosis]